MIVLKFNEKYLMTFGVLSKDDNPNIVGKVLKIFINFAMIFGNLYSLSISSAMYVYHNPNDVSGNVNAFITSFAGISGMGAYIGYCWNEKNIKILHQHLKTIVEKGKL